MRDKTLAKYFLIILLIATLVACFLLFRPFLQEIIIAAVLVSVFYTPYLRLSKLLKGRRKLSAFIMCILLLAIIILPITNLIVFFGKNSASAYSETVKFINTSGQDFKENIVDRLAFINPESDGVKDFILNATKGASDGLSKGATFIVKGTSAFLISLLLIILTMFFFFIDGEKILQKIKLWSPLPNKYDLIIFKKFREVSYTAMISTFVTAGCQGLIGAIGFMIVGLPAFYPGLLIAFFSLIPYVGAMLIYVPIGIYLVLAGQVAKGIFILAWGSLIIGNTDNIIRAYILSGKSKINPIFIIFSLLGGLTLFGFWGLILGPLILSLATTIFHIYELEYNGSLKE
jgi:predicted PurR-regulated permease PerM